MEKDTLKNSGAENSLFTFKVDDVEICTKLPTLITAHEILRKVLKIKGELEDFSHRNNNEVSFVKSCLPGCIVALHIAYRSHYPLKLSTSDFILLIGQGLSRHIKENAEKLRKHIVYHEGKKQIKIRRDEFVLGKQNDWSTTFQEFTQEIRRYIKLDLYDIVIDDTSVATKASRIASEISLMESLESYLDNGVETACGIPQITLEGTGEDWEKLRQKVQKLEEANIDDCLELNWWLTRLRPVVDKICDTVKNKEVDIDFWSGIYKYKNPGSGDPFICGWITQFIPYLSSGRRNTLKVPMILTSEIAKQISEVPFTWEYYDQEIPMKLFGGILGAYFDKETYTVQPVHFWSVNKEEADGQGDENDEYEFSDQGDYVYSDEGEEQG